MYQESTDLKCRDATRCLSEFRTQPKISRLHFHTSLMDHFDNCGNLRKFRQDSAGQNQTRIAKVPLRIREQLNAIRYNPKTANQCQHIEACALQSSCSSGGLQGFRFLSSREDQQRPKYAENHLVTPAFQG